MVKWIVVAMMGLMLACGALDKSEYPWRKAPIGVWWDTTTLAPSSRAAIDIINGQTCKVLRPVRDPHQAAIIVRGADPALLGPECDDARGCSVTGRLGCQVHVTHQLSEFRQTRLAIHELGHCLGLEHDEMVKDSAMASGLGEPGPITLNGRDRNTIISKHCVGY